MDLVPKRSIYCPSDQNLPGFARALVYTMKSITTFCTAVINTAPQTTAAATTTKTQSQNYAFFFFFVVTLHLVDAMLFGKCYDIGGCVTVALYS